MPATQERDGTEDRVLDAELEREFCVPLERLAELVRRVEVIDRRGRRLGTGPIRLAVHEADAGFATVVLQGEAPVLAGWELTAILDHRGEQSTLRAVTTAGETLLAASFAPASCEQCGVRRRRTRTFVLTETRSGRLKQVGSACLRDFLGGHDPTRLCQHAERLAIARSTLRAAHASAPALDEGPSRLTEFAAHAVHVVRAYGWLSRERASAAGQPSTADRASSAMSRNEPLHDADLSLAREAIRWAQSVLPTKTVLSDWERDVISAVNDERALGPRERGLLCALVAVYRRGRLRSSHLGRVHETIEVLAFLLRSTEQASKPYGTIHRHELIDANMNRLIWWQSQGPQPPLGRAVRLRGRVARHTRFAGAATTVLTRCRFTD